MLIDDLLANLRDSGRSRNWIDSAGTHYSLGCVSRDDNHCGSYPFKVWEYVEDNMPPIPLIIRANHYGFGKKHRNLAPKRTPQNLVGVSSSWCPCRGWRSSAFPWHQVRGRGSHEVDFVIEIYWISNHKGKRLVNQILVAHKMLCSILGDKSAVFF